MTVEEMAATILETVRERPGATFVEIIDECGPDAHGELALCFGNRPNLILWVGVSQLFADGYQAARDMLEMHPTSVWVYLMDGSALTLPVVTNAQAKRVLKSNKDFKKETWLPVTFTVKPEFKKAAVQAEATA
jgi:hypothetical protein